MRNKKAQAQKMYDHSRLMELDEDRYRMGDEIFRDMGLVEDMREPTSSEEYAYLRSTSQRPFNRSSQPDSFWIEGYPLSITPIRSAENVHEIEWSLENGDFLTHPFALAAGWDDNYQKFLSVIDVTPFGKWVPTDILVKRCGLLVTKSLEGDEPSYYVHDVCSNHELIQHKLNRLASFGGEVKIV